MSCDVVIRVENLGKTYQVYQQPLDRLKQFFFGRYRQWFSAFQALDDINFELSRGDVLGIIGTNGSGKSTLLQLVCGTLQPSCGQISVKGRIAALLELGAGFNPEFSGRENVYLNGAVLGLHKEEIDQRYAEIVAFSGIGDFIEQPVKTYSSGMFVRLAFAVAVSVSPDILIIDEALSVGDGAFARKSFDKIMQLKEQGATILFCSHSMYHIEALCNKAIWLERGRVKKAGEPQAVVVAYQHFLEQQAAASNTDQAPQETREQIKTEEASQHAITDIQILVNGHPRPKSMTVHVLRSKQDELAIETAFISDPTLPPPTIAIALFTADGRAVASSSTQNDAFVSARDAQGRGRVRICFPRLALLKGQYDIAVFLACEQGLHVYEHVPQAARLEVVQEGLEQGLVALPHEWSNP